MAPVILSQGPIPKIEEARDRSNWFEAILLSAIHLERYGYFAIEEHLKSLRVKYRKKDLKNLHLASIGLFLLAIKRIDDNDYRQILKVNGIRNKFMHRRDVYKFKPTIGPKAKEEYEPLVNEAIRILAEKLDAVRGYVFRG